MTSINFSISHFYGYQIMKIYRENNIGTSFFWQVI